jgi:beta-glucosidase
LDHVEELQRAALEGDHGIPLLVGMDAAHGHSYFDGPAVIFPHNIGLGATRNAELVQEVATTTAVEAAATGINWVFAPMIAVGRDERWGRTYECFGETTELQRLFADSFVSGLQGPPNSAARIASGVKHFVAEGAAATAPGMNGNIDIDEATLRERYLPGFEDALQAGALTVMASLASYQDEPIHSNHFLLTELLKEELGFQGLVVSNWRGSYRAGVEPIDAVNAGIDLHMLPDDYNGDLRTWRDFHEEVLAALEAGTIEATRIDDAVRRILRVKFRLNLFEAPLPDRSLASEIGSAEHRALARRAVRESLVLLKNEGNLLPLAKDAHLAIVGTHADNAGYQSGGWTKTYQGVDGDYAGATTILDGIREVAPDATLEIAADGELIEGVDAALLFVGETPYADLEGYRDAADMILTAEHQGYFITYQNAGIPMIAVVVSGRPIVMLNEITASDTVLAVLLPGSEGAGVADVLFGDFAPTGTLSQSWPRGTEQIPLNVDDPDYDPLFAYDFGLTYE